MARFFGEFYLTKRHTASLNFPHWLKGQNQHNGTFFYHLLIDGADEQAAKSQILLSISNALGESPTGLRLSPRPKDWRPPPCKYKRARWYPNY